MNLNGEAQLIQVLTEIRSRFGKDVFRNGSRLYSIICDLDPSLKRDGNILRQLIVAGCLEPFLMEVDNDEHEIVRASLKIQDWLENELFLQHDRACLYSGVLKAVFLLDDGQALSDLPSKVFQNHSDTETKNIEIREIDSIESNAFVLQELDVIKLQDEAYRGDPHAQYLLGVKMFHELGNGQNIEDAIKWIRLSASRGYSDAQVALGELYLLGKGVEVDSKKAFELFMMAAENGNAQAQNDLGKMYFSGIFVKQSYADCLSWNLRAAEQEYDEALNDIGVLYLMGKGVQQNYKEAAKWFHRSAMHGDPRGQYNFAMSYFRKNSELYNPNEAFFWFCKAAKQNYANAFARIGECYETGAGVKVNLSEAKNWYKKAAERNVKIGIEGLERISKLAIS